MAPKRISILGVGLLGGSIGLALKSKLSGCKVTGYGHRRETIDAALKKGAIDDGYDRIAPAVADSDLVVLCTPVGLFRPLLAELGPVLAEKTIVTDVGSTKRSIVSAARELLPLPQRFVASHPMAGSEKRGVQYSRADLYAGALCIITPVDETDPKAVAIVEQFWATLGMGVIRLTPEEHDRRLSDVSHLPHALAAALVSMQEEKSFSLAGKGFSDMTRIAGGDGALWRDILSDNKDNIRDSIERLKQRLDHLLALLETDQSEALRQWLDSVAEHRQKMESLRGKADSQ